MNNKSKKEKIAVAMSGGVDSSVSAWLLKEKGYEVAGFYFKLFEGQKNESLKKAKAAAGKLKIPLQVIDLRKDFKKKVVDNFISEYKNLRTPNPCVLCNKFIKFGLLLEKAQLLGYKKIATGHYATVRKDKNGNLHLFCGQDKNKDQSYFLNQLNQRQLSRVIFPLGEMKKEDVYKMAKKIRLPFDEKKESQEICFVEGGDYRKFLGKYLSRENIKPGEIINFEKEILGVHEGLINYTIGQRKGVDQGKSRNENKKPLYVVGFDKKKNKLLVGEDEDIYSKSVNLGNVHWISDVARKKAQKNKGLSAKIRYRHEAALCKLGFRRNKVMINFQRPQRAVTPGQYAAIYHGKEVLGGGKILK